MLRYTLKTVYRCNHSFYNVAENRQTRTMALEMGFFMLPEGHCLSSYMFEGWGIQLSMSSL